MPKWLRRASKILAVLVTLIVIAAIGGYWYERPLLRTGTGYAAHNACALTHLAGRSDPATDLPPNPLVPYLRSKDDGNGQVKATILGVLAGQKAWYTSGFGCTLADERPDLGSPTPVTAAGNPLATAPEVTGGPAVAAAIAAAFGDDLPADRKADLGTRAIVVVRDGKVIGERYAAGFSPTTPQLGWSMAKSVTSLLVGRLVREGAVGLSDDHLRPEWTDDRSRITVENLLRMTSGLTWDETYSLGTPITRMLYGEKDMGAYVAGQGLAHPVGTYQQYSSGSTTLLCSILAARTGVRADLPRARILGPLGLSSAVWEPDAVGTPVCSSYLWATPRDWAAIGQFALQNGEWNGQQLLPADWMATTTKVVDVAGEETGYAAGWWVNRLADGTLADPALPADAYWAQGHDGQRLYVVPSAKLVVVRLGFSPSVESADLRVTPLVRALTG